MDKDPLGHTTFTLFFDPDDPQEAGVMMVSTDVLNGKDFLDRLEEFIKEFRQYETELLTPGFVPPNAGH